MSTHTDATPTDRFSTAPISRLVGFQVEPSKSVEQLGPNETIGQAVVRLNCCTHHHNPMGRVHGGLIAALADAAMGIAFGRTLLPGEDFSTIDLQISFIRPIKEGLVTATATVIERGLRIGFVRCEITNEKESGLRRPVAPAPWFVRPNDKPWHGKVPVFGVMGC